MNAPQSCTERRSAKPHLASLSPTDEAPADFERLIRVRQYFYAEHLVIAKFAEFTFHAIR
jgi:hypothetical protein